MFLPRRYRYEHYYYLRSRRRRLMVWLALLLLLIGVGLSHHAPAKLTHPPAPAPAPSSTPAGKKPGTVTVTAADAGVTWTGFHGIALPASAKDGPRHVSGGLAWGFTDTPRGALLAAVNIAVRTAAQLGPAVFGPTIRYQVTGPDTAALAQADATAWAALRAAARTRPARIAAHRDAAIAGYRFESWAAAAGLVDVITRAPDTGGGTVLAVTAVRVAWLYGDWRVLAPPGGTWASSATTVPSLAGFTPFSDER
jgi:hypothetical protein